MQFSSESFKAVDFFALFSQIIPAVCALYVMVNIKVRQKARELK